MTATTRKLGFWMCTALVVGNIIGSAIYLLPSSVAPYGLNSLIAWIIAAAAAMIFAVTFAALGRAFPTACGAYDYTRIAFGAPAGFVVAWSYWISCWVGNAAIATGAISYFSALFPALAAPPMSSIATIALVWTLTGINTLGVRAAGSAQVVTTLIKILPLLAVGGLGLWLFASGSGALDTANVPTALSLPGVTAAVGLTVFALIGVESATIPGGKIHDPERTIPRATLLGAAICALLYIFSSVTVMLLIPGATLAQSNAPFADVARLFWGGGAALAVAAFAAISATGALNGWVLLTGEIPYQMARQRVFPELFARESRRGTPAVSLCIGSALTTLLILLNASKSLVDVFSFVVLLTTAVSMVLYLMCSLAVLKLVRSGELPGAGGRRAWLATVAGVGAAMSLWAIYGTGLVSDAKACGGAAICWAPLLANPVVLGVVLLASGIPVYYLMRRGRTVAAATT